MSSFEEHEEEEERITTKAAPHIPRPTTELAARYYVTLTWDDWPNGGSYGTVVMANNAEDAEHAARWEMANARDEFDHPADCIKAWGHDWHLVDCWLVDDFVARHGQK